MKIQIKGKVILLTLFSTFVASCSQDSAPRGSVVTQAVPQAATAAPLAPEEEMTSLGGTAWRLVQIMSMDDNTYVPDDPSLYTLDFGTEGTMSILADCNRGTGSWTSESGSQLQFGPIAATMAMCQHGSLHDRYMAQFEWVRSYVLQDGHLFLATMADGSIIEFELVDGD